MNPFLLPIFKELMILNPYLVDLAHRRVSSLWVYGLCFLTSMLGAVVGSTNQGIVGLHLAVGSVLHVSGWLSCRILCAYILVQLCWFLILQGLLIWYV